MNKLVIFLAFALFICNEAIFLDDCDDSDSYESHGRGHGGYGGGGNNGGGGYGGNKWTRPNYGCGNDWYGFDRPTGRWCFKVFGGTLTQAQAQAACVRNEGTLSAFMNWREQNAINTDALKVISQATGSIWLGLRRTQPCLKQPLNAQCTVANSFYYTDGSTTGTAGLVWDRSQNQPDNAWGKTQECAIYFAAPAAGQSMKHGKYVWLTQKIDDVQCALESNYNGPRKIVGYLCGRNAK